SGESSIVHVVAPEAQIEQQKSDDTLLINVQQTEEDPMDDAIPNLRIEDGGSQVEPDGHNEQKTKLPADITNEGLKSEETDMTDSQIEIKRVNDTPSTDIQQTNRDDGEQQEDSPHHHKVEHPETSEQRSIPSDGPLVTETRKRSLSDQGRVTSVVHIEIALAIV
ncbi:hypothetical protein BGZ65_005848, partial [Modicella reniformis]